MTDIFRELNANIRTGSPSETIVLFLFFCFCFCRCWGFGCWPLTALLFFIFSFVSIFSLCVCVWFMDRLIYAMQLDRVDGNRECTYNILNARGISNRPLCIWWMVVCVCVSMLTRLIWYGAIRLFSPHLETIHIQIDLQICSMYYVYTS